MVWPHGIPCILRIHRSQPGVQGKSTSTFDPSGIQVRHENLSQSFDVNHAIGERMGGWQDAEMGLALDVFDEGYANKGSGN